MRNTPIHAGRSFRFTLALALALCFLAPGDAMPRGVQILPTNNAQYKNIVAQYLAGRGLAGVRPNIVQILRVDLDGNGTDEVLIAAQNLVPTYGAGYNFALHSPLVNMPESSIALGQPQAGQYSLILLRRVVGNGARNIPLHEYIATWNTTADAYPCGVELGKIVNVADLNGDGMMEIVLAEASACGHSYRTCETWGTTSRCER